MEQKFAEKKKVLISLTPTFEQTVKPAAEPEQAQVTVKRILILRCTVVRHQNLNLTLAPGTELKVVREPENPYDRWATNLYTPSGMEVAYLPKEQNQSAARLIDAGKVVTAFVGEPIREPWANARLLPVDVYLDIKVRECKK